jgi:hypothetical protein
MSNRGPGSRRSRSTGSQHRVGRPLLSAALGGEPGAALRYQRPRRRLHAVRPAAARRPPQRSLDLPAALTLGHSDLFRVGAGSGSSDAGTRPVAPASWSSMAVGQSLAFAPRGQLLHVHSLPLKRPYPSTVQRSVWTVACCSRSQRRSSATEPEVLASSTTELTSIGFASAAPARGTTGANTDSRCGKARLLAPARGLRPLIRCRPALLPARLSSATTRVPVRCGA